MGFSCPRNETLGLLAQESALNSEHFVHFRFVLYDKSFFRPWGTPQASWNFFCLRYSRNIFYQTELAVLITNITFVLRFDQRRKKIRATF